MPKSTSKEFSPDFQNYRNKTRNDNKRKSTDSTEDMLEEEDDDQETPKVPMEKASDILGNSLSGMSKEEISKHHELCMRLAAENKITLKNSFGLHLIAIMKQMVKECPDLQLASLSLQASSKIYCGRVEALYKDTFQFHSNLQTMVSTGKKSKNDDIECNDEEDASEKGRSKHSNKSKSYLTSHESISMDSQGSGSKMPHSNFVVINSAFSASRSSKKLVSLPFESDSNKLCFSSSPCYRPKQPITAVPFNAHIKLTGILEKINELSLKPRTFEDMESSSNVLFQPDKSSSPKQNFEGSMYDDFSAFSPIREDNPEVDVMIDRFSILNITVDAFTQDIFGAVTSGNSVDALRLPPNSALKAVLQSTQKVRSAVKQKKEVKPKEPFFSGEPNVQKSLFKNDRKSSLQAPCSEWVSNSTSVFFSNEEFNNSLADDSNLDASENPDKERNGIQPIFRYSSDNETRLNSRAYFWKHPKVWERHHLRNLQSHKMRPSSIGMVLGGRSNVGDPSFQDLAQSFQEMSLCDSFGERASDNNPSPLLGVDMAFPPCSSPDLPDRRETDLYTEGQPSEISGSFLLERDVKSMMVTPPDLVKPVNVRFEAVPNSINMEKAKDLLWKVISTHLNENESTLLSKVHEELEFLMKSTPNSSKQSLFEGICLQFTFVILLILANEKILLLENIPDTSDIIIKRDFSEIDSSEVF